MRGRVVHVYGRGFCWHGARAATFSTFDARATESWSRNDGNLARSTYLQECHDNTPKQHNDNTPKRHALHAHVEALAQQLDDLFLVRKPYEMTMGNRQSCIRDRATSKENGDTARDVAACVVLARDEREVRCGRLRHVKQPVTRDHPAHKRLRQGGLPGGVTSQ